MGLGIDCVLGNPDYVFLGVSLYEQGGGSVLVSTGPQTETNDEQGRR
jgi:hypothetical protein